MTIKASTPLSDASSFREWLREKHPKQLAQLSQFEMQLRMGKVPRMPSSSSSKDLGERVSMTLRTVDIIKSMIGSTRWRSPAQLLALLRGLGKELDAAGGFREPAIGNVVRRVLAAVREEVINGATAVDEESNTTGGTPAKSSRGRLDRSSLESMLWALPQHVKTSSSGSSRSMTLQQTASQEQRRTTRSESVESVGDILEQQTMIDFNLPPIFFQTPRPDLKQNLMENIVEITSDLEDLHNTINDQATNHIHSGEVILTYGKSDTILEFLQAAAAKKLRFTVIVCEGAWRDGKYEGHEMARLLTESTKEEYSIEDACVIPDSAIFAMMARVNKVLLPAHAVLANGGLVSPSGCNLVALAAAENAVPCVCLTGIYKLTPLFPHEGQDTLNDLLSPCSVVDYRSQQGKNVDFINPLYVYIRPEHIKLYVTNVGSFQPSYIYRLLSEYYSQEDWSPF
jgi:translation initiation factor eIF-2B subunit beta